MELLDELINSFNTIWPPSFWDVLDIAVLTYLIYKLIQFIRDTRAEGLIKGILILVLFYFLAYVGQMKAVQWIFQRIFNIGIIAVLILFQPELRRTIERVGHARFPMLDKLTGTDSEATPVSEEITAICEACEDLSSTTTGALIVIERETKLGDLVSNGTIINAVPSKELFGTIFYPKCPLHDGAVIMRDGKIYAAGVFLPKPVNEDVINKQLGSRHRAAIGMSENSDAIVIVVSEETGAISIAENGDLQRGFSKDSLRQTLSRKLIPEPSPASSARRKKEDKA
ncbi:MAG: diadenylate cyclase CdaA [Oscillospiraceae bacterium]|nr:diadenylate cyclase CdaA [Oscillospiraceae bacterium]